MHTEPKFEQREHGWMVYPARGWRRFLFRLPLVYWRLGIAPAFLGAPFRFILLTTWGRRSHQPRHTPLEHSRHQSRIYIAPGWGERTQWYLNILADPHVTVQRGWRAWGALARRVRDDQELRTFFRVARGKSPVWKQYLASWGVEDTLEDFLAKKDRLVILRLDPTDESTPPGVKADLVWVWLVIAAAAAAVWLWR